MSYLFFVFTLSARCSSVIGFVSFFVLFLNLFVLKVLLSFIHVTIVLRSLEFSLNSNKSLNFFFQEASKDTPSYAAGVDSREATPTRGGETQMAVFSEQKSGEKMQMTCLFCESLKIRNEERD